MMATVVLAGLIYIICEVYLDDIIVHAKTQTEFFERLRQVFDRFRKHKITLNPTKCQFGLPQVEFLGHVLNEEGLSFSEKKKNGIRDFELPTHGKGLKSFLGLANYFRDHIKNHSMIVHPLQEMIRDYDRNRKLIWTPETRKSFEVIKEAITDCPTLYFMDNVSPIYLHTDASDYGIGAYLFQLTDGVEKPTAFISKTLAREQFRWSTPEKEAFAIYYALIQLEYLIRDVHFTIRTDHKNLTYINTETNPKVKRWKLAIQEFDFSLEHIIGKDNIIADVFSRLCPTVGEELCSLEESIYLLDEFRIPEAAYKQIGKVHNSIVGHHGVERTLDKLMKQGSPWDFMREHVRRFIKNCPCCQKMSYLKVPIHTQPFTTASYEPMERINIDSIGPLPCDIHGLCYIVVVICTFTRFVELYPVKAVTAELAAEVVLNHLGRYGTPSQILSDNGSQFVNKVIAELALLVGTEQVLTMAYSKEENSIVERANKEVMRHLRAILFSKNVINDWSKYLPLVQRIMNSTVHSSIGVSPSQLLFGNAINLDRGIFLPTNMYDNKDIELSKWAADMLKQQSALIHVAQKTQQEKDRHHMLNADPRRTQFPINSYVLIQYPATGFKKGAPSKLLPNLKGPMRVVSFVKFSIGFANIK